MNQMAGKQSVCFVKPVYILSCACAAGKKEGEGPLGEKMDLIVEDPLFGQENWEESESQFLKAACETALRKGGRRKEEVRMAFCGDLLGQMIASSFGMKKLHVPYYGVYGACSSAGAALSMAAMAVSGGFADLTLAACSSHFASAEKEFRFPLNYASQRPLSAQWTVTGAGAFLVGKEPAHVKITGITVGKIVDYGLKDSQNMGACMAPAACDTIARNLEDFERDPEDYSRIITGDLGYVGQSILLDLMDEKGLDIRAKHMDCGILIFDQQTQDTHAGGSGCGCAAVTLASYILPKVEKGEWERVLFVPTGALMSTVSFNEGASVPGIAHGIVLEHC